MVRAHGASPAASRCTGQSVRSPMFHGTASGSRPVPNKRIEKPSNCTTTTTITGTRGACSELSLFSARGWNLAPR